MFEKQWKTNHVLYLHQNNIIIIIIIAIFIVIMIIVIIFTKYLLLDIVTVQKEASSRRQYTELGIILINSWKRSAYWPYIAPHIHHVNVHQVHQVHHVHHVHLVHHVHHDHAAPHTNIMMILITTSKYDETAIIAKRRQSRWVKRFFLIRGIDQR